MDNINLRNMPKSELYEYAKNKYVWKILRAGGTREAKYLSSMDKFSEFIEVFSLENNGDLICECSGFFHTSPALTNEKGIDKEGYFYIFSYDEDRGFKFKQEQDLIKAPTEIQDKAFEMEEEIITKIQNKLEERKQGRKM